MNETLRLTFVALGLLVSGAGIWGAIDTAIGLDRPWIAWVGVPACLVATSLLMYLDIRRSHVRQMSTRDERIIGCLRMLHQALVANGLKGLTVRFAEAGGKKSYQWMDDSRTSGSMSLKKGITGKSLRDGSTMAWCPLTVEDWRKGHFKIFGMDMRRSQPGNWSFLAYFLKANEEDDTVAATLYVASTEQAAFELETPPQAGRLPNDSELRPSRSCKAHLLVAAASRVLVRELQTAGEAGKA